jgi:hypothetical protein
MAGETVVRSPQGDGKALREWQYVIQRNATLEDLAQAKRERIGTTFTVECGDTYRVVDVELDDLHRLIVVGQLEEMTI